MRIIKRIAIVLTVALGLISAGLNAAGAKAEKQTPTKLPARSNDATGTTNTTYTDNNHPCHNKP